MNFLVCRIGKQTRQTGIHAKQKQNYVVVFVILMIIMHRHAHIKTNKTKQTIMSIIIIIIMILSNKSNIENDRSFLFWLLFPYWPFSWSYFSFSFCPYTQKSLSIFFTATIYHTPKTAKLFKKFSFFITKYDSVTIVNEWMNDSFLLDQSAI